MYDPYGDKGSSYLIQISNGNIALIEPYATSDRDGSVVPDDFRAEVEVFSLEDNLELIGRVKVDLHGPLFGLQEAAIGEPPKHIGNDRRIPLITFVNRE